MWPLCFLGRLDFGIRQFFLKHTVEFPYFIPWDKTRALTGTKERKIYSNQLLYISKKCSSSNAIMNLSFVNAVSSNVTMILWTLASYLKYEPDKNVQGSNRSHCIFLLQCWIFASYLMCIITVHFICIWCWTKNHSQSDAVLWEQ